MAFRNIILSIFTACILFAGSASAEIDIDPDILNFGIVTVDQDSVLSVTITNVGDTVHTIDDLAVVGIHQSQFDFVSPPALPVDLPPGGGTLLVNVVFTPNSPGNKSAFLVVTCPGESPQNISLLGEGVLPDIVLTPSELHFPGTLVGDTVSLTIAVSNEGIGELQVTDLQIVGGDEVHFFISDTPALPFGVLPGETPLEIEVTFVPLTLGQKSAFLSITSNDPDEGIIFPLIEGSATKPELTITPALLDFGDVRVDTQLDSVILLENIAAGQFAAALEISSVQITGMDAASFELLDLPPLPITIGIGGEPLAVTVRFSPLALGLRSAEIVVNSNDFDNDPWVLNLSGNGVQPDIDAASNVVFFDSVLVGAESTIAIDIINQGGASLTITDTLIIDDQNGVFFIEEFGSLPLVVAPYGGSVTMHLGFRPVDLIPNSAVLQILSDDPDEVPFEIALSGRGVQPQIVLNPDSLQFDYIRLNTLVESVFLIDNTGSADLIIDGLEISGSNADEFIILAGPVLPLRIRAGSASAPILIGFEPVSLGAKSASLDLVSNDPAMPQVSLHMSGFGSEPDVDVEGDVFDFQAVRVGSDSVRTLEIFNRGGVTLTLDTLLIRGENQERFAIISEHDFPVEISGFAFLDVDLKYAPADIESDSAVLQIFSDDPDEPLADIDLAGEGVLPQIVVDRDSVQFGITKIGDRVVQTVTIQNLGGAPLVISNMFVDGITANEFSIQDSVEFPLLIGVDSEPAEVLIEFVPLSSGKKRPLLRIITNDPANALVTLSLFARGVQGPQLDEGPSLANIIAGESYAVSARVSADTTIRSVILRYGSGSDAGFPYLDTLQVSGTGADTWTGQIDGARITPEGLKLLLEITDDFPTSTTETLHASVKVPAGTFTFDFAQTGPLNQWRMFSLPFDPVGSDLKAIKTILKDLGEEGDFSWRIYRTDPTGLNQNYLSTANLESMTNYGRFEPGNAFWLYLRDDGGGSTASTEVTFPDMKTIPADSFHYVLQPGWNQVGNPYSFPISWEGVSSEFKDSLRVHRWDGNAWLVPLDKPGWTPLVNTNFTMNPWEGYYVENPLSEPVEITYHPLAAAPDTLAAPVLRKGVAGLDWQLAIVAETEQNFDVAVIGMNELADDGMDKWDFIKPGSVSPDSYIDIALGHPDDPGGKRWSSDFRKIQNKGYTWYLSVNSPVVAADFSIQGLETLPATHRVLLYDTKYLHESYIGPETAVRLRDLRNGEAHRFALLVGTDTYIADAKESIVLLLPEAYQLLHNYPNPFNPSTTLRYQLPEAGTVKLSIFNVLGQEVTTLVNIYQAPGFYEARWDGKDRNGIESASGLYFFQIRVNGFVQTEKMLKLK